MVIIDLCGTVSCAIIAAAVLVLLHVVMFALANKLFSFVARSLDKYLIQSFERAREFKMPAPSIFNETILWADRRGLFGETPNPFQNQDGWSALEESLPHSWEWGS